MPVKPDIQDKLAALLKNYQMQLPNRLNEIDTVWQRVCSSDLLGDDARELYRLVHSLAGSGASFGFSELSKKAKALENRLKPHIGNAETLDEAEQVELERLRQALYDEIRASFNGEEAGKKLETDGSSIEEVATPVETNSPLSPQCICRSDKGLVLIVDDDTLLAESLATQISQFGYSTVTHYALDDLEQCILHVNPDFLLVDMEFPEGNGADVIADFKVKHSLSVPVVFMSGNPSFDNRSKAVRAGGEAFLAKPIVEIGNVIDQISYLLGQEDFSATRILVIDDTLATDEPEYILALREVGFQVELLRHPEQLLSNFKQFNPELLMVELNLNYCDGMDLLKIVRHDRRWIDIPLVFLSSEIDPERQLEAISMGADDFIQKAIPYRFITQVIKSLAYRYSQLRRLMVCDGLTGLLNHTKVTEALNSEIERAKRQNSYFSYAMLDIDHFKQINDNYGHAAGDYVIQSLSRLLKQRIRSSDIVGRYGGEEFAVIFIGATKEQAKMVLDEIRYSFENIRHCFNGAEFCVTFSGGISFFPACEAEKLLMETADQALYQAKRSGRNQICIFDIDDI